MDEVEIETNDNGGRQSRLHTRMDLIDPWAMYCLGSTLYKGLHRYDKDNWRRISVVEHVNHVMVHLTKWLMWRQRVDEDINNGVLGTPRMPEDELSHAFCRLMFALAKEIEEYGIHPEHYVSPDQRPEASPDQLAIVRGLRQGIKDLAKSVGVDKGTRHTTAARNSTGWYNTVGPPSMGSGTGGGTPGGPGHDQ